MSKITGTEPPEPVDFIPGVMTVQELRKAAYRTEADDLFFAWQAGEIPKSAWVEARKAVKDRYPK